MGSFYSALVPVFTQTSEEELQLGVAAYKDNHYEEAIQHFEKAAELDPNNIQAHLYLATTHTSQYIPGVDTPDNISEADRAIDEYQRVLDLNASNDQRSSSCKGIAYLYLNMKALGRRPQVLSDGFRSRPHRSRKSLLYGRDRLVAVLPASDGSTREA